MQIKKKVLFAVLLAGMLGITLPCHGETPGDKISAEEIKKEAQDLLKALNAYTAEQKDEAVSRSKTALERLDKRIDELESRIDKSWDKMDRAAREKARESLKELRRQRNKAAEWYGSLKSSSSDAWEHVKKGFSDAYKALNEAWKKVIKEFGSGT